MLHKSPDRKCLEIKLPKEQNWYPLCLILTAPSEYKRNKLEAAYTKINITQNIHFYSIVMSKNRVPFFRSWTHIGTKQLHRNRDGVYHQVLGLFHHRQDKPNLFFKIYIGLHQSLRAH